MSAEATATRAPTATAAELRRRAQALLPQLRARREETDQLRAVPSETIQELRDAGLLRILQPARFGGSELGYDVINEVAIDLAGA